MWNPGRGRRGRARLRATGGPWTCSLDSRCLPTTASCQARWGVERVKKKPKGIFCFFFFGLLLVSFCSVLVLLFFFVCLKKKNSEVSTAGAGRGNPSSRCKVHLLPAGVQRAWGLPKFSRSSWKLNLTPRHRVVSELGPAHITGGVSVGR